MTDSGLRALMETMVDATGADGAVLHEAMTRVITELVTQDDLARTRDVHRRKRRQHLTQLIRRLAIEEAARRRGSGMAGLGDLSPADRSLFLGLWAAARRAGAA